MKNGKRKRFWNNSWKLTVLLISVLLILNVTLCGTIAYLTVSDISLKNIFNPSKITTAVSEEFKDGVKSNVKIQNTGDTDAWIRAAVIVTWKDAAGNVYGKKPVEGTDYEITWNTSTWLKGNDGFWYYSNPVLAKDGITENLIHLCKYLKNAPAGYYLNVEILGSGIQKNPAGVFSQQWGDAAGIKVNAAGTKLEM